MPPTDSVAHRSAVAVKRIARRMLGPFRAQPVGVKEYRARLNAEGTGDGRRARRYRIGFMSTVRHAIDKRGSLPRLRSMADRLRRSSEHRRVGDAILGALLNAEGDFAASWEIFRVQAPEVFLEFAPVEYLHAAFKRDVPAATAALETLIAADDPARTDAEGWIGIAGLALVAGRHDLATACLAATDRAAGRSPSGILEDELVWMHRWLEGIEGTRSATEPGAISFGVLDYKQPDYAKSPSNLGDYVQTIASLGHLVRQTNIEFVGDPGLSEIARALQSSVRPDRRIGGPTAKFALTLVERDGSRFHVVPPDTWMLAFGWYKHPTFGTVEPLTFHEHIRPVFVSVHLAEPAALTDEAIEYLQRYGPVGCRDWSTVHLLLAAGVPAFFSGCLTTTVDTVFPPRPAVVPDRTLFIDTAATEGDETWKQAFPAVRARPFLENLQDAVRVLDGYRATYHRIVTSRLHAFLPARSLGAEVEFRPNDRDDPRFDGLIGISDEEFAAMRTRLLDKLEQVIASIAAGEAEPEVYARWRDLNADDVEAARRHSAG